MYTMNKLTRDKSRTLGWTLFMLLLLLHRWMEIGLAQENKVDLAALTQETQKTFQKVNEITIVWWIPEDFWRVTFAEDPTITESQAEEFLKILRPYTIIVVVDGKVGKFGGVTYKSEADIRATIRIIDNQGTSYLPLSKDKLDADTKNFLSMVKPALANMLGPMGENMHFFFFFQLRTKKVRTLLMPRKKEPF